MKINELAYSWFRSGWIMMQAHPIVPDADMPTGSPEWDLAMDLHAPRGQSDPSSAS